MARALTDAQGEISGLRWLRIEDWDAVDGPTLRGFFVVTLPTGLELRHLRLDEHGGIRWIAFPGRHDLTFIDQGGARSVTKGGAIWLAFANAVFDALDKYLQGRRKGK
jgi:hypothetical protein